MRFGKGALFCKMEHREKGLTVSLAFETMIPFSAFDFGYERLFWSVPLQAFLIGLI